MMGEEVCLQGAALGHGIDVASDIEEDGFSGKTFFMSAKDCIDGYCIQPGKGTFVLPKHIRLARGCYAKASDADREADVLDLHSPIHKNKRGRNSHYSFWSRVDAGEIKIQRTLDEWRLSAAATPTYEVHKNISNYEISTTNLGDYPYKSTPFGDVYYSPRYSDHKYTYRFVILTKGVRNEAHRILKNCGAHFLTEAQIIHQLGIDLSPGWEHFMVYRNRLDELILRRPFVARYAVGFAAEHIIDMTGVARWIELLSKQKQRCFYVFQLDGIGILRQLLFEEFLYRKVAPVAGNCAFFLVNNHSRTGTKAVVMGLAGKAHQFVRDVNETKSRGITIIRRFTGGGTVIVDECSVNTSLIASTQLAKDISPTDICRWSYDNVFRGCGIFNQKFKCIEGDFVVEDLTKLDSNDGSEIRDPAQSSHIYKVAGNSQAFNNKAFVHHSVFPWSISPLISQVLLRPTKMPKYRDGRDHISFVRSVRKALDPDQCLNTVDEFEEMLCKCAGLKLSNELDRRAHVRVSVDRKATDDIDKIFQNDSTHLSEAFIDDAIATLESPATMIV
ncbi:cyclin-dependent kinase regulatory subunit [Babesia ovata]|uniref:Cyclin-dependent kinases regulatory subunit n=1 Tax=Babesia ovata TaxID=189622 RepID=A0A2H6KEA1_9APIC|nr:cyclin-dependent kinase regulatory subunit [Babesia ovata]GBE61322.1 cyclin-dependent kinase regulatory subunit [Babesia ovata]